MAEKRFFFSALSLFVIRFAKRAHGSQSSPPLDAARRCVPDVNRRFISDVGRAPLDRRQNKASKITSGPSHTGRRQCVAGGRGTNVMQRVVAVIRLVPAVLLVLMVFRNATASEDETSTVKPTGPNNKIVKIGWCPRSPNFQPSLHICTHMSPRKRASARSMGREGTS